METNSMNSDVRSTVLARRMFELRSEKMKIEAQVNSIDAELDQVKTDLAAIMEDLGVQKFGLDGIGTFYLATNIYPKISDSDKMIEWLDAHGNATVAPRKVHIPSLRELVENNMKEDLPIPDAELLDMTPQVSVRLRMSKKEK